VTRIRLILLAALAMAAVSVAAGAGASSAFAGNGPLWLVNGTRFDCQKETGQYKTLLECLTGGAGSTGQEWNLKELTGTSGLLKLDQGTLALALNLSGTTNFTLHTSVITIVCKHMNSNIVLVGGTPAKDHAIIHFLECEVEGHPTCTVKGGGASEPVGLIQVAAKSEVIYLGSKKEAEKEEGKMGDLFSPESGETFVELVIGGTGCPLFSKGEQEVKGTVIGEIEPVGTMGKTGLQIFPTTAITEGYRWKKSGEVEKISSSLKVFGVIEATQIGEAEVMLNSNEEWGVEQK
jgi:alpha-D-ribose 1-methylphosphonate 5-triphosphate synthase subunit PhnG